MSALKNPQRFCVFCYKTLEPSFKSDDSLNGIKKFIKILNSHVKVKNSDVFLLETICDIDSLLECCTKCKETITTCSDIFHQLKTLELQLDWQLDKLARKINHANKVPARWINFNKILGEHCQDNLGKKVTSQRLIRDLRKKRS